MKSSFATTAFLAAIVLLTASTAVGQKTDSQTVPKYDPASEATFKGTVIDVIDHQCPVSGGLGAHLNLKLEDGKTIEVHLAATKFVKRFDIVFNKGDKVEVVGVKLQFEGKETIFAREVTRGSEVFTFRDKNGEPAW
jgi:DNA/RNA endonuclease YhcR with UshA esterase domain